MYIARTLVNIGNVTIRLYNADNNYYIKIITIL